MLINCEKVSERIKHEASYLIENCDIRPTLAIVRVDGDEASKLYVNNKVKACKEVGIKSIVVKLPSDTTEDKLISEINKLNNDKDVNAILVQLPLPEGIDERVVNCIDPIKDADCLTDYAVGKLFNKGDDIVAPCTPTGIIRIIKETVGCISGNRVLVINRSMLVGKPLVELLQREDATVTLAHSKTGTETLKAAMAISDIIVTAVGKPDFITKEIVNEFKSIRAELRLPPQILIDVSMNRDKNGKLCGDVSKELYESEDVYVTPVPKGVGLTTVASLLINTVMLTYMQKTMK